MQIQLHKRVCVLLSGALQTTKLFWLLQSEFLNQMGVTFKAASWWSIAVASGAAALLAVLAGYAIQRFRMRQEMHSEIHEIM